MDKGTNGVIPGGDEQVRRRLGGVNGGERTERKGEEKGAVVCRKCLASGSASVSLFALTAGPASQCQCMYVPVSDIQADLPRTACSF